MNIYNAELLSTIGVFAGGATLLGLGIARLRNGNTTSGIHYVCLGAILMVGGAYLMNSKEEKCLSIWENKTLFMEQISKEYDVCKSICQNKEPNTRINCLLSCFEIDACRDGTLKQNIYWLINSKKG